MIQVLTGGSGALSATRYMYLDGHAAVESTRQYREMIVATGGILSNLSVVLTVAPGVGTSRIFTVMLNGVAQSLAVTISGTDTSGSMSTNPVTVAAGDQIVLRSTVTGAPAAASARWASQFEATTAQTAVWGSSGNGNIGSNVADRFGHLGANALDNFAATTAAAAALPWQINATITSLYVILGTAPGAGNNRTFSIYVNGNVQATSTVTIAETDVVGNATGFSVVIAPGDLLSIGTTPTSSPTNSAYQQYGVAYTPTVDGQWNISGELAGDYTSNDFVAPNGMSVASTTETNHAIHTDPPLNQINNWRIRNLYFATATAPGLGDTRTITLRKSGSNSAVTTTISDAATSASTLTNTTMGNNDYITMQLTKSAGADASTRQTWGMLAGLGGGAAPPGGGGRPGRPRPPGGGPPPGGGGTLTGPVLKKLRFPEKVI